MYNENRNLMNVLEEEVNESCRATPVYETRCGVVNSYSRTPEVSETAELPCLILCVKQKAMTKLEVSASMKAGPEDPGRLPREVWRGWRFI